MRESSLLTMEKIHKNHRDEIAMSMRPEREEIDRLTSERQKLDETIKIEMELSTPQDRVMLMEFLDQATKRIVEIEKRIYVLEKKLEQKREELLVANGDMKKMEILRINKANERKRKIAKSEADELDEIGANMFR